MEKQNKNLSRKKFISWSIGLSSLLMVPAFLQFRKKKPATKTVKMLTQDGRLVEILVADIPDKKKKIGDEELLTWVNRKISHK